MFTLQPEKWVERYSNCLAAYARNRVPHNVVQDLVQETFYAGLKSASNFKAEAKEITWLTSILRHKIYDYFRKVYSNKGNVTEGLLLETDYNNQYVDKLTNLKMDDKTIETEYDSKELEQTIEEGILTLSESERQVFTLRLRGYSTSEVCKSLKLKENHCWVLMCRARKKMRSYLNQNWERAA